MPDPTAQDRLARLVDLLTPAAALGIGCPHCGALRMERCDEREGREVRSVFDNYSHRLLFKPHVARLEHAKSELHAILLHLLPETR